MIYMLFVKANPKYGKWPHILRIDLFYIEVIFQILQLTALNYERVCV